MSLPELDLVILKNLITNKKHALDFVNECDAKLFSTEAWNAANIIIGYIKTYKDIPTLRVITERLEKGNNTKLIEHIKFVWAQIEKTSINDLEYKHNLEKLKQRFAEHEIFSMKDKLINLDSSTIDINKTVLDMQKTVQSVKNLNQTKAYERKTLKDSVPLFREEYNAKLTNPNFDRGIKTGYSYFDYATDGCRPGELILIGAESGAGKCHAKGQKIIKYDGTLVNVEDIKINDILCGPDGPKKVLSINTGHDYMFDIVPNKGSSWRVNIDHILTLINTNNKNIIDISVKEYLNLNKSAKRKLKLLRSEANFSNNTEKSLMLPPYFLGLLLGDGCLCNSDLTITSIDLEVIKELNNYANLFNLKLNAVDKYSYRLSGIKGKPNPIMTILKKLSLKGTNSHTKFIPMQYKTATKYERLELLAGLIDTDGHYDGHGCFDFITASKLLANDFVFVARSVGLAAYIKKSKKTCCNNGVSNYYYRICVSGNTQILPCKIARKISAKRKQIKNVLHVGFKVVPTNKKEDYYGFTLNGDGRYLLDDFTITHNSMLLMNMAIQMWLQDNNTDMESGWLPGNNILYFSLEMPFKPCLNRVLSRLSSNPSKKIRNASLDAEEARKLKKILKFIDRYPYEFEIIDIPRGATMESLELIYEDVKANYEPKIIVIDYLGLMAYEGADMEDWLKLGKIAEKIHEFARVHGCIVLSAVQLNRVKPSKDAEEKIGLHRVGRSALILQNANIAVQIETRPNEKQYPDMIYHLIKNRDGCLGKGRIIKNLANGTLIDDPVKDEDDTQRDPDDISGKIDLLDI